ncbi:Laminin G domain protein [Anaerohalosphaera lusitana]|uniref:Laminin G domain protein n=1 Tax=Anaerohalosphaera lusitana TaxID=1936003 RepID=A0A1U9NNI3_9BACT|nr:LamG-like jellyroll fold domain-containing protein [Anaerohalosphaera lusitana]AQT69076.1 Laminin G domain protein [Anaerohalosphaera lusitana]
MKMGAHFLKDYVLKMNLHLSLFLILCLFCSSTQAWDDPVSVTASSQYYGVDGLIDGSVASYRDSYDANYYGNDGWLFGASYMPTNAIYDFGSPIELRNLVLWNWSGDWSVETDRGVREFSVSFSDDGAIFTGETVFTASEAISSNSEPAQAFAFDPTVARYAKITILSNHGDSDWAGIGELRFNDPTIVRSSMVYHWNFDEGPDWHDDPFGSVTDATITKDYGSGADAELVNMDSSNWVSGRQFTGLEFDGTEEYLSIPTELSTTLGGSASLLFWTKTTQTGSTAGSSSPGLTGVVDGANGTQWGWIDDQGRIALSVGATVAARSADAINDDKWHHIAIVRDAVTGDCSLYVDGELSSTGTAEAGAVTASFSSIGRIENTSGSDHYFQGRLDQVYVFDSVLDEAAIQLNMNNHAPKVWESETEIVNDRTCSTSSVLFHAYDPEVDTLSVEGYTSPSNGTISYNGDGTFDYTANAGFVGQDQFYAYVSDGNGGFEMADVYVDVREPGQADGQKRTTNFTDFQAIQADGTDISLSGMRVPRVIDWESDGDNDLLLGHGGSVWLYENIGTSASPIFAAAVKLQANGADISLSGSVAIALADMTGDGVDDLVAVDYSRKIRVYRNTSVSGQIPVYTTATFVQDVGGGDFVSPDIRFDLGDWDSDGRLDIFTGTFSGTMRVYLNAGSAANAAYDASQYAVLESASYNLYPRYFDLTRNNMPDLIRGINWGSINYWFDSSLQTGLGTNGSLVITDSSGTSANINGSTDGAIVDFADFNGDDVYDILIGGHASDNIYIAYGVGKTVADYIADLEAIYDAHPADLGLALEANDQALLQEVRIAEQGIITHMLSSTLDQRQTIFDQMAAHVQKYAFLQLDQPLDTDYYHHVPSIAGQNLMTMHHMLPDTPTHRVNVADALGLIGLKREIYLKTGLNVGDNQRCSQGQLESIRDFMSYHPREAFPDSLLSIDAYFDWGGGATVNTFTSGKNTFGSETGWDTTEYAADLREPIATVFGDLAYNGDYFTLVMAHEVCHSLDGYVASRPNKDLYRRWGQMLVYCAGPDVIAGDNGWMDWTATKQHFYDNGYWDGVGANWQDDWDAYWATGPGSAWSSLTFTRGGIGWFLNSPQESLATQANLHWPHSEGRLVASIDRYRQEKENVGHMISIVNEVVTFFDFVSAGLNKVVMYNTRGTSDPYPRATYDISYAYLERNDSGYITKITVEDRVYDFTLDADGRVTGVQTNSVMAVDDSAVVNPGTNTVIDVLANDSHLSGGSLVISDFTQPANGTVTDNNDGTLTYHSTPEYSGKDTFTYTVASGSASAVGNVVVNVLDEYGTIHRWRLDDSDGTTAEDSVGTADGTVDGASWTAGKIGGALMFDGDDSVLFSTTPSLEGQVDFSVAAWVKTSSATAQTVVQQRVGGYNGEYVLNINSNGTVNFMIYGDNAYQFNFSTYDTVNDGQWHHLVAVRDGRYGFIFIDGVMKGADHGDIRNLSANIGVSAGNSFNGQIDDIRICSKALSSKEVGKLYDRLIKEGKMTDLQVLASNWLALDCGSCDGADLDGNSSVDLSDLAVLAQTWLAQ